MTPPPPPRQQLVGSQFSLQTLLATTDPPSIPPQNHATPPSTSSTSSLAKKFWLVLCNPILLVILCLAATLAKRLSQRSCERLHFQLLDREADTKFYHLSAPTTRESSTNILRSCTVISTVGYFVLQKKSTWASCFEGMLIKRKQLDDN